MKMCFIFILRMSPPNLRCFVCLFCFFMAAFVICIAMMFANHMNDLLPAIIIFGCIAAFLLLTICFEIICLYISISSIRIRDYPSTSQPIAAIMHVRQMIPVDISTLHVNVDEHDSICIGMSCDRDDVCCSQSNSTTVVVVQPK